MPDRVDVVARMLRSELDWYSEAHREIWKVLYELRLTNQKIDTVTVAHVLRQREKLASIGGAGYLGELIDATPAIGNLEAHVELILDTSQKRRLISEAQRIAAEGYGDVGPEWVAESAQAFVSVANERDAAPVEPAPSSIESVLATWQVEGPMIHEPTGFARLDELTGGGPVFGSRWYLLGAPDAGKTALIAQIADTYARRGVTVGMLAIDEEPSDIVTRFLQRAGFTRAECEQREGHCMSAAGERVAGLPLHLYDAGWTIERAANDLAARAAAAGSRACLMVDSVQTVRCEAELSASSVRESVTARVQAIRAVATRHRLIVMATSEMGRQAYRSVEAAEATDDMASAKESGAIEYSARVMLALRSVANEHDLLELRIAKNKHGPRDERIGLRINRRLQQLDETDAPERVDPVEHRDDVRAARGKARTAAAAAALVRVVLAVPGIGRAQLTGALRNELGECGASLAEAAVLLLGAGLVRRPGARGRVYLHLAGAALPLDVVALLPPELRAKATAAQPPDEGTDAAE